MIASDLTMLHGPNPFDFMLAGVESYIRPYGTAIEPRFMGRIEPEVTLTPAMEYAEWNTGMPSALYIMRATKVDYSVKQSFKQIGDPTVLGLALNAEVDYTDPDTDVVYFGNDPNPPLECQWFWQGQFVDGRPMQIVFRRAIIANPEDLVMGSGEYTNAPVTVRAMVDDQICDGQRNLGYVCIGKLATPSGGFADPCAEELPAWCEPTEA